jgi:hypothetical protein
MALQLLQKVDGDGFFENGSLKTISIYKKPLQLFLQRLFLSFCPAAAAAPRNIPRYSIPPFSKPVFTPAFANLRAL